jgi:hypothetical protein
MYVALMIRRIIIAMKDPTTLDDKDYYGNKRLELYALALSFSYYYFISIFLPFSFLLFVLRRSTGQGNCWDCCSRIS